MTRGWRQTLAQPHPDPTLKQTVCNSGLATDSGPTASGSHLEICLFPPQTAASSRIHTSVSSHTRTPPTSASAAEDHRAHGCPQPSLHWVPSCLKCVFSNSKIFFAPSCALVLSPANPRFHSLLDQCPGLGYANFFPIDLNSLLCSRFCSHLQYALLWGVLWSLAMVCWTLTNPRSSEVAGNTGWRVPVAEGSFCPPC